MNVVHIETPTHGRVLVQDAADSLSGRLLVVFHGYGQAAEDALNDVLQIPGASSWRIAAVQALHRFYTRGDAKVVGSWMTRQDREHAIADNIAYVDRAIDAALDGSPAAIVYVGFSQGAAMAYRAAVKGRHRATGVIALSGDVPPELKDTDASVWPPVLVGAGDQDPYYTSAKVDLDVTFFKATGIPHNVIRFSGGHEWTDEFRRAAGEWLAKLKFSLSTPRRS